MHDARTAVDRLLRGQRADFTPLHDNPWGDTLEAWVKQGMPAKDDGKAVDPVDHFGFDLVGCGGWYRWTAKPGPDEIIQETGEWKTVRNGNGAVLKWWKHRSGTPEHVAFHMTTREIWEKEYKPHLLGDPRDRVGDLTATRTALEKRRSQGKWTSFGSTIVWENLRASLGDENMFVALTEGPDWIHDFNRVYTDLAKRCYAERWGDRLCFIGGLDARVLESGDREVIRREVTRLVTGMRERGARYVFGSDHSISTAVRYDDFLYALEVYRELREN